MRSLPAVLTVLALGGAPAAAAQGGAMAAGVAAQRAGLLGSSPADARRGFWVGGGLGAAASGLHCGICDNKTQKGTSGYLRIGTTMNRKLLIGLELGAWQRSGSDDKRRLLALTVGTWWYPSERQGYFLRWGAGISRWRAWQENEAVVSQALALVVGAGFETRLNPGLSFVPYINALGSSSGALWLEQKDAVSFERRRLPSGGHALLFQIGIGLTRH